MNGSAANLRMVSSDAVERDRRDDRVDPAAVGQAGVDHRAGLVDAPARPGPTILSMVRRRCASSVNAASTGVDPAGALDVDLVGPLTMISVTSGSRSSGSSGPWPRISSATSCGDPGAVGRGERGLLVLEDLLQRLPDPLLELALVQVRVVQLGPEALQQGLVHARA